MTGLVHDALRRTQRAVELLGELVVAAKRIAAAQEEQVAALREIRDVLEAHLPGRSS